jgi:hypothetical protein
LDRVIQLNKKRIMELREVECSLPHLSPNSAKEKEANDGVPELSFQNEEREREREREGVHS